jgi:hypothetical protein
MMIKKIMTWNILPLCIVAALMFTVQSCEPGNSTTTKGGENPLFNSNSTQASELSPQPIIDWMELLYYHIANEKISPPLASRIYGYTGVLIYESVICGLPDYNTMEGQLNGFENLPRPDASLEYDWLTVMNDAIYFGINYFLERQLTGEITTLNRTRDDQIASRKAAGISDEVIERSKKYGRELAFAIEEWAKQDNFDKSRLPTQAASKALPREGKPERWETTDFGQVPMEPYWGELRPFVLQGNIECRIAYGEFEGTVESTLPEFSTDPESEFYKITEKVYEKDQNLTEEERIIALFWADDPGETSTPPGHWIYIMNNMVKAKKMNLGQAAEIYGLTCLGIADAFIAVWDTKYKVYMVRPKTYIRENMGDPGWEPYVETPPFPEYASGHSGVSGAAATLLTSLIGDEPFVDSTHLIIGLEPRAFDNFWHAAREAAESRHYGGIHYRAAIEDALDQGKCVAGHVMDRIELRRN